MLISQTSIDTRFKIVTAKQLNTDPYYHQLLQLVVLFVQFILYHFIKNAIDTLIHTKLNEKLGIFPP
jgi:hypothetical protein